MDEQPEPQADEHTEQPEEQPDEQLDGEYRPENPADTEEVVLLDEDANPCGTAPRWVMRAANLRHGATGILVRNSRGQVYVHRRTDTKDVYPGHLDFAAGGVLVAGEDPLTGATRELAEELGITGVELQEVGEADYLDEQVNFHAWLYSVVWDGPIVHQPSEVAWGRWMDAQQVDALVADPEVAVMPDSVALWQEVGLF